MLLLGIILRFLIQLDHRLYYQKSFKKMIFRTFHTSKNAFMPMKLDCWCVALIPQIKLIKKYLKFGFKKNIVFCWLGHLKMPFYYPTSHRRARGSILLVHYSVIILKIRKILLINTRKHLLNFKISFNNVS